MRTQFLCGQRREGVNSIYFLEMSSFLWLFGFIGERESWTGKEILTTERDIWTFPTGEGSLSVQDIKM
jgi:hypothetical protein